MTSNATTQDPTTATQKRPGTATSDPGSVVHLTTAPGGVDKHEDALATEFAHLDPRTLTIEVNVRTSTALTPSFVGSIRQYGVITPVLVVRTEDGQLLVRAGQRRTLAAIEAGLSHIPARIIDAGPVGDRFVQQLIENDQREAITDAERTDAIEQMHLDLGLNAAQIAGRLSMPKTQVRAALRVAGTTHTRTSAELAGITLDQAAMIAAFDDDPAVVDQLTQVAMSRPEDLAHEIQRVRDDRAEARARAALTEDLSAAGITVLDQHPGWNHPTIREVRYLRDSDGQRLDANEHAACPGLVVTIDSDYWSADLTVSQWCRDFTEHGHQLPTHDQPRGGAMSEADKADRAAVVAGNKAWRSARTVRREWLATLAARRSAPKGTTAAIGWVIAAHTSDLDRAANTGHRLARELLALPEHASRHDLAQAIENATPGRANIITLTIAVAAIEAATDDMAWRRPVSIETSTAKYLRTLETWGYTLSEIERRTAAYPDADDQAEPTEQTEDLPDTDQDAPETRGDYTIATTGHDGQVVVLAEVRHIDLTDEDPNGEVDPLDLAEYDAD